MTYEGKRAGEGYFSADGTQMVFQSERDAANPFYQIFLMDMTTGDVKQVSSGTGKTTCAFIRPGAPEILYASTHHDPKSAELQQAELDFRASGKERRYSWDYDPEMELWATNHETGESKRLTHDLGYDAEASYSPDGQWIVYSSTRTGYAQEMTDTVKKQLEIDPAFYAELYVMKADGSEDRRLDARRWVRRRAVFLPGWRAHRLAPLFAGRSHGRRLLDQARWHRREAPYDLRCDELGSLCASLG